MSFIVIDVVLPSRSIYNTVDKVRQPRNFLITISYFHFTKLSVVIGYFKTQANYNLIGECLIQMPSSFVIIPISMLKDIIINY